MNALVEIKNLSAGYDGRSVLQHVDFAIHEREFTALTGPNGGGKTTLLKVLLGLLQPYEGTIKRKEHLTVGYLPQNSQTDKNFPITVEEVVLTGLKPRHLWLNRYSEEDREQVRETLCRMGLEGMEDRPIGELSGGQMQRALLGRAIVSNPELLILDEPGTYVDKHFERQFHQLLQELNLRCAILMVSHDLRAVLQQAHSVAYVDTTLEYFPDAKSLTYEWLTRKIGG